MRGKEPVEKIDYLTTAFSREAASFVDRHASRGQPFFLILSYNAVHFPWVALRRILPYSPKIPRRYTRITTPVTAEKCLLWSNHSTTASDAFSIY